MLRRTVFTRATPNISLPGDKLFDKVLVANRGEIACRVMKTCQRLGIRTVAVHSTADTQSKFVRMADESVCIGPPPSLESYLSIEKIVAAAIETGAQAVHPGYGFLSERPDFSAALKKNNIKFIGPDEESMDMVSDKIQSKILATEAKVSCIPGFQGEITSHDQLLQEANKIGYPIMVKASGGGGGKGMHVANNDAEAIEYFELCRAEAISAFNNGKMLVEKFVEKPRHIEVQIIADRHGNTLYLPERECSIQRRNQKVLEEAPSTFIDPETRKRMGEEAAAYARRVNYVSAGTVEMMVDKNKNHYFLEMNTRLQVEHPITELITGVDLVEQMIRAAADLPLSIKQEDIKINGWATEARVCAEDPTKKYFPSIGRLSAYKEPKGEGVRVDSGIIAGSQISVYYDSLIAKLCTWAPTRNECLKRLEKALDEYVIRGLSHNVCLLRDVIHEPRYLSGDITTNYLPEMYPDGFKKARLSEGQEDILALVSAAIRVIREARYCCTASRLAKKGTFDSELGIVVGAQPGDKVRSMKLSYDLTRGAPAGHFEGVAADRNLHYFSYALDSTSASEGVSEAEHGHLALDWQIDCEIIHAAVTHVPSSPKGKESIARTEILQYHGCDEVAHKVQIAGTVFDVAVLEAEEQELFKHMAKVDHTASLKKVAAPMPGVVVDVKAEVGKQVVTGDELLTLEAMKMRNKIRSEIDGEIKEVKIKVGDKLEDGAVMVVFK